jgi:hypothetical protein
MRFLFDQSALSSFVYLSKLHTQSTFPFLYMEQPHMVQLWLLSYNVQQQHISVSFTYWCIKTLFGGFARVYKRTCGLLTLEHLIFFFKHSSVVNEMCDAAIYLTSQWSWPFSFWITDNVSLSLWLLLKGLYPLVSTQPLSPHVIMREQKVSKENSKLKWVPFLVQRLADKKYWRQKNESNLLESSRVSNKSLSSGFYLRKLLNSQNVSTP